MLLNIKNYSQEHNIFNWTYLFRVGCPKQRAPRNSRCINFQLSLVKELNGTIVVFLALPKLLGTVFFRSCSLVTPAGCVTFSLERKGKQLGALEYLTALKDSNGQVILRYVTSGAKKAAILKYAKVTESSRYVIRIDDGHLMYLFVKLCLRLHGWLHSDLLL